MVFKLVRRFNIGALAEYETPVRSQLLGGGVVVTKCSEVVVVIHTDRDSLTVQFRNGQLRHVKGAELSGCEEPTDADLDMQARVVGDLIRARRLVL
jgi:hypothetical protein